MIVLDANILLYATDPDTDQHEIAYAYLLSILEGNEMVGFPMQSVSAFLRISTQRGVLRLPFSMKEALHIVEDWLRLAHVRLLVPGDRYWSIFRSLLVEGNITGRSVTDAEIAAVTIEYGGELQTNDRGFARYPELRWNNPLVKA